MRIIALESASQGASVAVWHNGRVLASCEQEDKTCTQAEILVPMLKCALQKSKLLFADIDLFAVTVGPGSFTGVRVGLATARGLGLAAERPVAGVTTTEVVAWIIQTQKKKENRFLRSRYILVALYAQKAAFYVQPFLLTERLPVPLCSVQTLFPTAIATLITDLPEFSEIVGNDLSLLRKNLPITTPIVSGIQPKAWATAAVAAIREEQTARLSAEPLYSRRSVFIHSRFWTRRKEKVQI